MNFNMNLTAKPFKHQQDFIEFSDKYKWTLCGDEMGLGKTLSAIGISVSMGGKTLVVSPAFLKFNWKAEFLKFTDIEESEIFIVGDRFTKLTKDTKVIITSYSRLKLSMEYFSWADHVIADEAHYLKNLLAKRTRNFHNGVSKAHPARLTLLSGTAVKNRVAEFYSLLKLLAHCPSNGKKISDKFRTEANFARHFSNEIVRNINVRGRRVELRTYEGLKNEKELRTYFQKKYMRRLTRDVIDLPALLERYVEVKYSFDDKELENYEQYKGKKEGHIMAIKRGSAMAKASFTTDYAKNIFEETNRPVVIFSDHVDPVHIIASGLKRSAYITGSTKMEDRHAIVSDFQSGKLDYLVATIGAASTGITLTAAQDLVFNDMSYIPADNAQASKRIHRIGQNNTCRIHKMCGSVVDRMIMTSLTSKQEVIDKVL